MSSSSQSVTTKTGQLQLKIDIKSDKDIAVESSVDGVNDIDDMIDSDKSDYGAAGIQLINELREIFSTTNPFVDSEFATATQISQIISEKDWQKIINDLIKDFVDEYSDYGSFPIFLAGFFKILEIQPKHAGNTSESPDNIDADEDSDNIDDTNEVNNNDSGAYEEILSLTSSTLLEKWRMHCLALISLAILQSTAAKKISRLAIDLEFITSIKAIQLVCTNTNLSELDYFGDLAINSHLLYLFRNMKTQSLSIHLNDESEFVYSDFAAIFSALNDNPILNEFQIVDVSCGSHKKAHPYAHACFNISDEITRFLEKNPQLSRLSLEKILKKSAGIIPTLLSNINLTALNISDNHMSVKGFRALAEIQTLLTNNATLTELNMVGAFSSSKEIMPHIGQALKLNKTLTSFKGDLKGLNREDVTSFIDGIRANDALSSLELDDVDPKLQEEVITILQSSKNLIHLEITGSSITSNIYWKFLTKNRVRLTDWAAIALMLRFMISNSTSQIKDSIFILISGILEQSSYEMRWNIWNKNPKPFAFDTKKLSKFTETGYYKKCLAEAPSLQALVKQPSSPKNIVAATVAAASCSSSSVTAVASTVSDGAKKRKSMAN